MAALPTGSIISVPFKRTHDVSLSDAIKDYISTKYDQHPDMFVDDLSQIDELRRQAVAILEPHASGIRRLQCYAAQLVFMTSKFPVDVGADFTWYPAIGYNLTTPVSQNNIRFELANVLFNLAVLYCQLAVASNRGSPDGLKAANNYFCLAAGVVSHINSEVMPEMRSSVPSDMDTMTLECLESLFLAQAQECFWQKAVKDGMKDASIAKLAAKVSDLYLKAYDFGTKSSTISSEWIHHMNAKHNHFAGAAQYRAALDCLEKRKYGEEVARLRDSLACANNALKESRYVNKIVQADMRGLKDKVEDDLQRAEKDNDMIYLIPVPPKSELIPLDRASMVSARVPREIAEPMKMLGDGEGLGQPLFSKLVPYSVHIAASIYANRKEQIINGIVDEYESLTASIHSVLQSLNLPGALQAMEKPLGLPPGILSHAEEIRQQNGPERLARSISDVDKLKRADRTSYDEGVALLRSELGEDESARRRYGTERWMRLSSQEVAKRLYSQVSELEGYLKTAEGSDATIRKKLRENEPLIKLLNDSNRVLEDFVPSSRHANLTSEVQRRIAHLRAALNNATRLESRRSRKIESLRLKAQSDDVRAELLKEAARLEREFPMQTLTAVQFEDFFDKRLTRYDVDRNAVNEEKQTQDSTLSQIREANTQFATARRGDTSTSSREQALQRLENAYFAYKDNIQNLNVGRKFYNELAVIIDKFRDDCKAFAYSRRIEAAQLEADIANALPLASLSIEPTRQSRAPSQFQQPKAPHASRSTRSQQQDRAEHCTTPLPAPIPVRPVPVPPEVVSPGSVAATWDPNLPIRFAGIATPQTSNGSGASKSKDGRWDASRGMQFGAGA